MQRLNPEKSRINVQSVSFDGSVFNAGFYPADTASEEERSEFRQSEEARFKRLYEQNIILVHQMVAYIHRQYDETVFMVGSARQSIFYDALNPESNKGAGSCYPYLFQLCNRVAEFVGEDKLRVDPYLLADTFGQLPFGASMNAFLNGEKNFVHYEWLPDTSKLIILYAQMHKIASENEGAEVVFDYYLYDRNVINKLHVFFENNPDLMPGNLRLRLHEYNGVEIKHKTSVQGSGGIDYNFNQNVIYMIECAGINPQVLFNNHVMDALLSNNRLSTFRKNRKMMRHVVEPESLNSRVILQQDIEPGAFNPDSYLFGLRHQIGLLKEDVEGSASRAQRDFIHALDNLHNLCREEVTTQVRFNISPQLIERSEAKRIADYTEKFIRDLRAENEPQRKADLVKSYREECHKTSTRKKVLKVIACVVAAAVGFLIGGAIGLGIGVGAGAFLGPGAGVTGLAGMFAGATAGAKAGLAIGATVAGVAAGSVTAYGFFRNSKVQNYADRVAEKASDVYKPVEMYEDYDLLQDSGPVL